ncbi:MAG: hypothetical protein WKG07_38885 [Hymenobacter sp.]
MLMNFPHGLLVDSQQNIFFAAVVAVQGALAQLRLGGNVIYGGHHQALLQKTFLAAARMDSSR